MRAFSGSRLYLFAVAVLLTSVTFDALFTPISAQTVTSAEEREALLVPGNLAELEGAISEIRALLDEMENSDPDGGWITNGKADYQAKLNTELAALLDIFSGSEYEETRSELTKFDLVIRSGQDQMERLKTDLRLAPIGNGQLSLVDRALMRDAASGSENAIKADIAATQGRIDIARTARTEIIAKFIDVMAVRFNFILSEDQAKALLYQVNGFSIVQSKIIFETVVALENHLRASLDNNSGASAVQRYYSVAAVSRLMLVRMYQIHREQYKERWLPGLAKIEAQNEDLMTSTRISISEAKTQSQRAQLENNLKIQEKTSGAILVYQNLLEKRLQNTLRGLEMSEREAAVAINTLKTLEGVFGLSAEMLNNTSEYETLMLLNSPELLPLDGEMLDQSYIALNQKLGES